MKNTQKGFTLIELMIVVAIIGILAAVAIPAYQDYTVKAKLANALTSVSSLKTAVSICIQEQGGVKADCTSDKNGVPKDADFTKSKEVDKVAVSGGTITATLGTGLGKGVDGKTITFTPTVKDNMSAIDWQITTTVENAAGKAHLTKTNASTS